MRTTGGKRDNAYRIIVLKPQWTMSTDTCWCSWEDNIEVDLQETRWKIGTGLNLFFLGVVYICDKGAMYLYIRVTLYW